MFTKAALAVLLPFVIIFSGCRKGGSAKPSYTAKMGGIRNWHRSHFYEASGMHYPTPIHEFWYLPDTSLAVTAVNDTAIRFMGKVFPLEFTYTADQMYRFGNIVGYRGVNKGEGIDYYFAKDSIVYSQGDLHMTSDYWALQNLYYTY